VLVEINELSCHMYWADGIIWDTVLKLPEKENHPEIKKLLYHIHSVQNAYLNIWLKQPVKFKSIKEFSTYDEVARWGSEFHSKLKNYMNELSEKDQEEIINIPWTKSLEKYLGKPAEPSTLIQQIFQVILHSSYHRGQVNKQIREAGGKPPLTDYIYWVWIGKPERSC
jgi:uncharacterized damage-inducible protein DinB